MRLSAKGWGILAVGFLLFFAIYQCYPLILFQVMAWQKAFNAELSASLKALGENQTAAGITLVTVSFLYGVFHAVGPGHGKFILSSYLSLEKTQLRQAMKITLSAALVQGVVAVLLVSVLVVALTLSRHYFNVALNWVERGSFALMILFGLYWCVQAVKALIKPKKPRLNSLQIKSLQPLHLQKNSQIRPLVTPHIHDEHCGCGHTHLPSASEMAQVNDWKSQWLLILSIGARPCSGAILVLFLAYTLELYPWGVVAALVMALGTGATLSLFAYVVIVARNRALRLSQWYISAQAGQKIGVALKLSAGVGLILLAVALLHGSFLDSNATGGLFKR